MKTIFILPILLLLFLTSCSGISTQRVPSDTQSPYAFFAPREGDEAFGHLYQLIAKAQKYVYMTIYSWREEPGLEESLAQALINGAQVKLVLHPGLPNKSYLKKPIKNLELAGAEIKVAYQNMHEKFTIIDGIDLLNSSANMTSGARDQYSENFIFHQCSQGCSLIDQFLNEFTLLWNSSKDVITHQEENAAPLDFDQKTNDNPQFFSSSNNWLFEENKQLNSTDKKRFQKGQYLTYQRNMNGDEQTFYVRDKIIKLLDAAQESIYLSINHFNLSELADALIDAVKRGVEVKMVVDNQEFALEKFQTIAQTPYFVQQWREIRNDPPPVRVKFYSFRPSFMYWFLNHHKYILIDQQGANPVLISGSYNFSKNAEHNQFDNIVIYQGSEYRDLHASFMGEFEYLWNWNTDRKDKLIKKLFNSRDGAFPIHLPEAVAIDWEELESIYYQMLRRAPGLLRGPEQFDHCHYYNPDKQQFLNVKSGELVFCGSL